MTLFILWIAFGVVGVALMLAFFCEFLCDTIERVLLFPDECRELRRKRGAWPYGKERL